MRCAIHSLTSFVLQDAVSQILVIQMVLQSLYPVFSILPNTVSSLCDYGRKYPTDSVTELSIAPEKNTRLVPPHERANLTARGIDLDNFVPLPKDEMLARLD